MAFSIPNVPTDNLYKFYSISGVVIFIFSLTLITLQYDKLKDKISSLQNESNIHQLKKEFLDNDIKTLGEKVTSLNELLSDFKKTNDIPKREQGDFQDFVKNLQNNSEYREYMEFTYKYENQLIPGNEEKKEIYEILNKIILLEREHQLKDLIINSNLKEVSRKYNELNFQYIICSVLFLFSFWLMKNGFDRWQEKVQGPIDEKLKLEIQILKIQKEEIKKDSGND